MKKVLSVLAVLAVAAGFAFADSAPKSFKLTTSVKEVNKFKVYAPTHKTLTYTEVVGDTLLENLGSAEVSTEEKELKTVAVATNLQSHTITVTATGTALKSETATTTMGYTFTVDSNTVDSKSPVAVDKSATAEQPAELGKIVTLTGDGGQNVAQALLKATVNSDDYKDAAAGNYEATVTLTVTGA